MRPTRYSLPTNLVLAEKGQATTVRPAAPASTLNAPPPRSRPRPRVLRQLDMQRPGSPE